MNLDRYRLVDGKYVPIPKGEQAPDADEYRGDYWRVWRDQSLCFLEYDEGHFATKMKTVEISEPEYRQLAQGGITVADVLRRLTPGG